MKSVTLGDEGQASRSHITLGWAVARNSTHPPAYKTQHSLFKTPCRWCRGRKWRMWSDEEYSHEETRPCTMDDSELWVCTAPLGRPVVPDVYKMSASEEGLGVGGSGRDVVVDIAG